MRQVDQTEEAAYTHTPSSEEAFFSGEGQQLQIWGPALKSPLVVSLEVIDDDQIMVADELLGAYGVGENEQAAARDMLSMLLDTRSELKNSTDDLSEDLKQQLRALDYFLAG